ncbi:Macrolide-specific efflux protein MacA [Salmonella enterica subsp. arizonae]|nr:Macrolide-specific efflux protein MacA [Salmonella enterica subsp. arizonae]
MIAAQQAPNILTLADMSTMLVKAQVSEADVIHLRPGAESVVHHSRRSADAL